MVRPFRLLFHEIEVILFSQIWLPWPVNFERKTRTFFFESLNFMFLVPLSVTGHTLITQNCFCPPHASMKNINNEKKKVIKNLRVEDDSINGSQLIHQNVVGRRSSQWAASLKWKNKCDEEKEDCKKWNEQTFFYLCFVLEVYDVVALSETIKLTWVALENNSMSFYAFLRPLTVYDLDNIRRWLRPKSNQSHEHREKQQPRSVENCFIFPCRASDHRCD